MDHTTAVKDSNRPPKFDKLSFVRYMKNIGRAYRKQATELVSICRVFVQAQEQTPDSDSVLRDALKLVDDAFKSATDAGKKTSNEVDEKFARAVYELSNYERAFHSRETVTGKMEAAKSKDKTSSTILNTLKEKLRKEPTPEGWSEPTKVVEFVLCKSLPIPDDEPTVVRQVLSKRSNLAEVLWNFSRCKDKKMRLTLKQNPHFYTALPTRKEAYGSEFRRNPVEQFTDAPKPKIYVLVDRPGRIYMNTSTDQNPRAFGNFWVPNKAIIFKDVCGKLEGESIIGVSIQGIPNLQYRIEPSPAPPTNSDPWEPLKDWREPIHHIVNLPDIRIHIGTPQSKPLRSTRVLPPISKHTLPRSPNQGKLIRPGDALPVAHTQTLHTAKTGTQSNDEAPQFASPNQHSQTRSPAAIQAKPPPTPGCPSIPSIVPVSDNTSQSRGLQVSAAPGKISRQSDRNDPTPKVAVSSPPGVANPHSPTTGRGDTRSVGDARSKIGTPSHKVQFATITAPEPASPLKAQGTQPAQPQPWYISIWNR